METMRQHRNKFQLILCVVSLHLLKAGVCEMLDMSHPLNNASRMWPGTGRSFSMRALHRGLVPEGFWVEYNDFVSPEHVSTHIDAPIHFNKDGWTLDEIPLENLIRPAVVIDISKKSAVNPLAELEVEDVAAWESANGRIPSRCIVIVNCGWEQYYADAAKYFGNAEGDVSQFRFPGVSPNATRLLVEERQVVGIGLDTPSLDNGHSVNLMSHRITLGKNAIIIENLKSIGRLPIKGATLYVMPMKLTGGSGGPSRILGVWNLGETSSAKTAFANSLVLFSSYILWNLLV